ncbi:aminotransferase class I/II-fold pyridoxal phosphate-dependent enzyme [Bifidobacterium choloepi]|uniref:alanine transaminase n=1 Tax=Bifidobacterium choloepi TaxID=2614131 RepID=A0A6I5N5T4_9BIFI|nr:aminotransferase class I/II-fold pyridoxal phosphate-dependent enzyme [Bifidobacterium choloepi]NEG69131.1 aminotransferase class I/II-fold pyridoxal phosphate-dependent enzyme [Bifidobacterium choloepi]
MPDFSERLNRAMHDRGLKQVDLLQLAEAGGVKLGKSQLSQYLNGKFEPRRAMVHDLELLLGVSLAEPQSDDATVASATTSDDSHDAPCGVTESVDDEYRVPLPDGVQTETRENIEHELEEFNIELHDEVEPDETELSSEPELTIKSELEPDFTELTEKGPGMRTFSKSHKLDNVLYDVRGPVVQQAAEMERAGTHVLKLNIGNPAPFGFRTPDEIVYDMAHALPHTEGYSESKGLFSARKAIMQYAQLKHLPNVTIDDIYTGNGVSELINLSMSALLDNGDEVLLPSPDYPLWTACVTLAGGQPVHYVCDEQSDWYPDVEDMRSKITDKTKAIVIINPNNPTGALYPREVLQQIVDLAREHQLMIFSDEIYDRLVMDGLEHVSIASMAPDLFCVTFSGLSKSHMIAGYRIGWMILSGNKRIGADYIEGLNMLTNMRICSNVPAQSIVQTALGGHQSVNDYIVPGGRIYEQREYVYEALNSIPGITAVKPKAAFYIFPKIDVKRFHITDDVQFALDLLNNEKLLIVQGSGFNWHQPDHFRVVYLPRVEVLKDAVGKLTNFFSYYRQ